MEGGKSRSSREGSGHSRNSRSFPQQPTQPWGGGHGYGQDPQVGNGGYYGAPQPGGYAAPYPAYQQQPPPMPSPSAAQQPARAGGASKPRLDRRYSRIADDYHSVDQPCGVCPPSAALQVFDEMAVKREYDEFVVSADVPPREPELETTLASRKIHGDVLQNVENPRFTYKELDRLNNKFEHFIGQGGFGLVYYGCLEDGTEVAVKMRSESTFHGLDDFFAEVQSLTKVQSWTKVQYRNLVSLVGYCWEKDHLALVYEYMSQGTLYHLRGNNSVRETLNRRTCVRVAVEAAQ
uniref:Protein kinase domain-containing protein n=1 Tax=Oryza brachyantha TaxID=4533 RepID=J3MWR1_ORYBR